MNGPWGRIFHTDLECSPVLPCLVPNSSHELDLDFLHFRYCLSSDPHSSTLQSQRWLRLSLPLFMSALIVISPRDWFSASRIVATSMQSSAVAYPSQFSG